jgi:hypothetical protein
MEDAAKIDDPVIAARVSERADEYLLMAKALETAQQLSERETRRTDGDEDQN